MTTKLVIDLKRFESEKGGRIGAVFDLTDLSPGVREVASGVEKNYAEVIRTLNELKGDSTVLDRWHASRMLNAFFVDLDAKNVRIRSSLLALARDSGLSRTELKYLMKFYRLLPERHWISGNVKWSLYKGLLDKANREARMNAMAMALRGDLKTEHEVRHVGQLRRSSKG